MSRLLGPRGRSTRRFRPPCLSSPPSCLRWSAKHLPRLTLPRMASRSRVGNARLSFPEAPWRKERSCLLAGDHRSRGEPSWMRPLTLAQTNAVAISGVISLPQTSLLQVPPRQAPLLDATRGGLAKFVSVLSLLSRLANWGPQETSAPLHSSILRIVWGPSYPVSLGLSTTSHVLRLPLVCAPIHSLLPDRRLERLLVHISNRPVSVWSICQPLRWTVLPFLSKAGPRLPFLEPRSRPWHMLPLQRSPRDPNQCLAV